MYDMPQQVVQSQMHQPYQDAGQSQQHQQQQQPQQHQQQPQQHQQPYQTVIQNQNQSIQNVGHLPTHAMQQQHQQQQHQQSQQQQPQQIHQEQTSNANANSAFDIFDNVKAASGAPSQQSHANRYANNIGYVYHSIYLLDSKMLIRRHFFLSLMIDNLFCFSRK